MPFDACERGEPKREKPSRWSLLLIWLQDFALACFALEIASSLAVLALFAVDGVPPYFRDTLMPVPHHYGSLLGAVCCSLVWLTTMGGFLWWKTGPDYHDESEDD